MSRTMRAWAIPMIAAAIFCAVPRPADAARTPHVLVLNSYHPQYTWTEELVRGVRDELAFLPPENLHIEFMDARRMVDDSAYLSLLAATYQHKYSRFPPDVIISSDDSALTFLLERREQLFPGIPVIFCGINSRTAAELEAVPNLTGILEGLEIAGNLQLIRRLHPDAERVVLLSDRTSLGRGMTRVARSVIPRFEGSFKRLEIWDDFTLDELEERVAWVGDSTIFLLLAIHEDRGRRYFSYARDLKTLTDRSRSPMYAMFGMLVGQGVIGGVMNDPYEHGRATAARARKVLRGTPADAMPIGPTAEYRPRFDYAMLQRFRVSEDLLPPGSLVLGRPRSFYEQHSRLVWATSAVFLVLVLTIAWLVSLVNRMRRAERELRVNQAELRRAQQLEVVGMLAGGIAHDFNNVLTAISGFTLLAAERAPPDDPVLHDHLNQIERASQRAARLTRQLLSFARRQPVEPRVVDLNAVVMDVHKLLRRLLSAAVELVILPAPEAACVYADRGQLEQVLSNLATNARDAMPHGGKLTLSVSVTSDEVSLQATDTGTGMSDEVRARIFEPFYTTKEAGRGTGLGLATSFSIIEQAKGSIDVDSALGRGTTITIRLPRTLEPPSSRVEWARSPPRRVSAGLVLIAEDDAQVRGVAAKALEQHGFKVLEAENGAVAIELAEQHSGQIACVLTDVVMPILGGNELVRRLRLLDPGLPVVVMSGYVDDSHFFEEAAKLDVRFIPKPFHPVDLVVAVSESVRPAPSSREVYPSN